MALSSHCALIEWMRGHPRVGDILEIGALIGNGTRELAWTFPDRTIYTVELFNIEVDKTVNDSGTSMSDFYRTELDGQDQYELFCKNTEGLENVRLLRGDSRKVAVPSDQLWFVLVDGGHSPEVIRSDFYRFWSRAHYVAFHDYRHDICGVTQTVDKLAKEVGAEVWILPGYAILE